MAEPELYVRQGGLPWKADEENVSALLEAGGKPISKEEAVAGNQAIETQKAVDQNWGVAGKLGLGLASGLSLGLAPGMMGLNPEEVQAAQTSSWYTGGDIAGTVLPGLISGGGSLEERGALGLLSRATPAGILDMAGSGTERLLGS